VTAIAIATETETGIGAIGDGTIPALRRAASVDLAAFQVWISAAQAQSLPGPDPGCGAPLTAT